MLRRVAELESQNIALQRQHRALESDTGAQLAAKHALLKSTLRASAVDKAALEGENTQLKADARRLRAQRDALSASASANAVAMGEMEGKVAALEAERRQWRTDSDELRGTVRRLGGKLAQLRVIKESMGAEVDKVLNGDKVVNGDKRR